MKVKNLFLGMACMAAFAACGNEDEVLVNANQPHEMSITLSTGADTRTALAEPVDKTGNYSLTRTWKTGETVTVAYLDEDENNVLEKFTLVSGGGTTEGTFTNSASNIPTTGTINVDVMTNADDNGMVDISKQGDGSIDSVGDYEVLTWGDVPVTNGKFGTGGFNPMSFIIHIPVGFGVYSGSGSETVDLTVSGTDIGNKLPPDNTGITLSGISLTDGKLAKDVYVSVLFVGFPKNVVLKFGTHEVKLKDLSVNESFDRSNGAVFHLSESSKVE